MTAIVSWIVLPMPAKIDAGKAAEQLRAQGFEVIFPQQVRVTYPRTGRNMSRDYTKPRLLGFKPLFRPALLFVLGWRGFWPGHVPDDGSVEPERARVLMVDDGEPAYWEMKDRELRIVPIEFIIELRRRLGVIDGVEDVLIKRSDGRPLRWVRSLRDGLRLLLPDADR